MIKKIFITIIAVVLVASLAASAMAKGLEAPKELCVQGVGSLYTFTLGIKKGAKFMLGETRYDGYAIQGIIGVFILPLPATGAGYMSGNSFLFSMFAAGAGSVSAFGNWDVATETGSVSITNVQDDGITESTHDLVLCP